MSTLSSSTLSKELASYGGLANTVEEAKKMITFLKDRKAVENITVTGELAHRFINGYTTIHLLALPVFQKNIVGDYQEPAILENCLFQLDSPEWIMDQPPVYKWQGKNYKWKLTIIDSKEQLVLAQILNDGPEYFANWLSKPKQHSRGALPWGFMIKDYRLYDNNKREIPLKTHDEFWAAINYLPISLDDRMKGNPQYWRSFEKV